MKATPIALALCILLASLYLHSDDLRAANDPAQEAAPDTAQIASQWRAISRFGYGPSAAEPASLSGRAWAVQQLATAQAAASMPARIPPALSGFETSLPELFTRFREERQARRQGDEPTGTRFSREMTRKAAAWRLAACSRADIENPLLARMTEFWFNHLNVYAGKGAVRPFVGHYVVSVIRPHALGRYEDLLLASARHPAMLLYLDQAQSVADGTVLPPRGGNAQAPRARGLNENYARELMELHTLGVSGGYTQADVRELARVLTGWTVDPRGEQGFRFAPRLHDDGAKTLLGQRVPAHGMQEGEWALRMLARQPATARRIGLRLAQWFVTDQPPPALVQRLARQYLASQGDIAAVMRVLIESPETWAADSKLFKTPMDYACSVLAAAGGAQDEKDMALGLGFLANAGQPMHGWQTPDGYKTDAATWLSPEALSRRADFAMAVGRRLNDAGTLQPWLTPATRERIAREPTGLQAGLALASPEFMQK